MTEFVGRGPGGRPYSYAETPRGGGLAALARNFASGPTGDVAITTQGIQIPWTAAGTDVPITPRVTGIVIVRASIGVQNTTGASKTVIVEVQVDGVTYTVPDHEEFTVAPNSGPEETSGFAQIPVLTQITGLVPGVLVNIQIKVTALTGTSIELSDTNSTIEIQEVPFNTG